MTQRRPTLDEYDEIRVEWREKDKVAKLLGMYSAARLYADWEFAVDSESAQKNASWATFVGAMKKFYKPRENTTLKNYHFSRRTPRGGEGREYSHALIFD